MLITTNKGQEYGIYGQGKCNTVAEVSRMHRMIWRVYIKWVGKQSIGVDLEGLSQSGNIVMAAFQPGINMVSMFEKPL